MTPQIRTARTASECPACHFTIKPGDKIAKNHGQWGCARHVTGRFRCIACNGLLDIETVAQYCDDDLETAVLGMCSHENPRCGAQSEKIIEGLMVRTASSAGALSHPDRTAPAGPAPDGQS